MTTASHPLRASLSPRDGNVSTRPSTARNATRPGTSFWLPKENTAREGGRTPVRASAAGLLALSGLLLSACSSDEINLQVTSLATEDSPLYAHAQTYLDTHAWFGHVSGTLDCPEGSDGSDGAACLLRLAGDDDEYEGASRSLVLYVATGAQPLPGNVDLAATRQEAYNKEPINYASSEEVNPDDPAKRYQYTCTYDTGTLYLFNLPVIGEVLTGQFEDLRLSCTTQLNPTEVVPASLTGTFRITLSAAGF